MKIAIASGKGGAGKTSVAAALLQVWDRKKLAVDADVEAPNLHLFLKPENLHEEKVYLPVPVLDPTNCTACGDCRNICQYKAIIKMGQQILIYPEMCHACGACFLICKENCLREGERELGSLLYQTNPIPYLMGRTRIGEAMTPPLLKKMQAKTEEILSALTNDTELNKTDKPNELSSIDKPHGSDTPHTFDDFDTIIDSPPGVSCPAMTVVRESDVLLLVAEPTPFGFYDFKLAHAAFKQLNIPTAVIINKINMQGNEEGDALMHAYCHDSNLRIVGEIPFSEEVARFYAKGMILSELSQEWEDRFKTIALNIQVFIKEEGKLP